MREAERGCEGNVSVALGETSERLVCKISRPFFKSLLLWKKREYLFYIHIFTSDKK